VNVRTLFTGSLLLAITVVSWSAAGAAAAAAPAKDDGRPTGKGKSSTGKFDISAEPVAAKPRTYKFKATKKGSLGGAQVMTLVLDDPFGGRGETLPVQNNSADAREYDPLTSVAEAVRDLKPGTLIDVTTEKQKGKNVVTAISKTELKPGEELANSYVFVESKEEPANNNAGGGAVTVTLSKYGREVTVGVPMVRNGSDYKPDPKIDYVINRAQSGTVVEAKFRNENGRTVISEIHEYRKPERGTFGGLKETEFGEVKAAGFVIKADDGTDITFTLPGRESSKNGQKYMIPDPQALALVQRIKPDTQVEVRYHLAGRAWVMHGIDILTDKSKGAKPAGDDEMMKMDKDKSESDKPDSKSKDSKKPKAAAKGG
jgi:hypothetical protein